MSEKQNKLQRLEGISESYQVDAQVANRAIEQIERGKAQKQTAKRKPFFKVAYSCVALVCVVAIGLAVYFGTRPAPIVYFDSASVELIDVDNVEQVLATNNANVEFFNKEGVNKKGVIKENGKLGYIKQEIFFSEYWDNVLLYAVVLDNADFDFETYYDICELEYDYNGQFKILYLKTLVANSFGMDSSKIEVKFTYQNHDYFMTIDALGDVEPTAKIAQYVDLLINN